MRPPQPPPPPSASMSDPRPPPPQGTWYPNQFQYHVSQPQPPPPPPQPHQSMWPNHSEQQHHQQPISASYPSPHQPTYVPPYPTHPPPPPQPQNHYYPPPPPPYANSQPPQAYPQPNTHQTWGNSNWTHHQVWEHPDRNNPNNNEEEWGARARAWIAAKSSMDSQHQQPQTQFTHISRPEEHNHGYQDQYQRLVDPHYANIQQPSGASHQPFSVTVGDTHRAPVNHLQELSSFSSGPSSHYVSDPHVPYTSRDGHLGTDPNPAYPHQGIISTNTSGYQQEVPSSYSSVPGKGEVGGQDVRIHAASPMHISSSQDTQHHAPAVLSGRSVSEEQPYFTYGAGFAVSATDPSDRPLEFASGFHHTHELHDQQSQSSYAHPDPAGTGGYMDHGNSHSAVTVPGVGYPPSGIQFDSSFSSAPMFGQIPGQSFRSNIPPGGPAFVVGAGTVLHPTSAFLGDPNGVPSDRPKKASVPNWLREEIIKKKPVIASSSQEHLEEDPDNLTEDNNIENSFVKRELQDSKSIDSSRSSDDEDDMEAARTAAINQEIKRVLTEVLLKVTDELFDEIATKVLNEDDLVVEVDHNIAPPNQKLSPFPPSAPLPKASAKILIPVKTKETKSDDASGASHSGSGGDVLGLGSYASDDDDYDGTESSSTARRTMDAAYVPANTKLGEDKLVVVENGHALVEINGPSGTNISSNDDRSRLTEAVSDTNALNQGSRGYELNKNFNREKNSASFVHKRGNVMQEGAVVGDGESSQFATDGLNLRDIVGGKNSMKAFVSGVDVGSKSLSDISQAGLDQRKSEAGSGNLKSDSRSSSSGEPRRDESYVRKEKTNDRNGLKEKVKDRDTKLGDRAKESDSRKRSHSKDDKTETEKVKKDGAKDDGGRKRVRGKDEREERLRNHGSRDYSSHKRRHSPSLGGRVRNSNNNSIGSHANESSDDASEDSRKKHSRKRSMSPSPTRSRRRQLSRSPHSKHSHRRHSPYSSLEGRRGRRSRSNSPVRRRR